MPNRVQPSLRSRDDGGAVKASSNSGRLCCTTCTRSDVLFVDGWAEKMMHQDSDIADVYRAADVFVLPSRYEPFGMTAVQAMACGTPTVVTTHGGLDGGLIPVRQNP